MPYSNSSSPRATDAQALHRGGSRLQSASKALNILLEARSGDLTRLVWTGRWSEDVRSDIDAAFSALTPHLKVMPDVAEDLHSHARWISGERARLKALEDRVRAAVAKLDDAPTVFPESGTWYWDDVAHQYDVALGTNREEARR